MHRAPTKIHVPYPYYLVKDYHEAAARTKPGMARHAPTAEKRLLTNLLDSQPYQARIVVAGLSRKLRVDVDYRILRRGVRGQVMADQDLIQHLRIALENVAVALVGGQRLLKVI